MSEKKILRLGGILLLAGIGLICLVIFAPNAAGHQAAGSFLTIATSSTWGKLSDLTAAWCSLKIILFSLGLFLIIDVLGTALLMSQCKKFVGMIYALHIVPGLGVLMGGYYLLKALL